MIIKPFRLPIYVYGRNLISEHYFLLNKYHINMIRICLKSIFITIIPRKNYIYLFKVYLYDINSFFHNIMIYLCLIIYLGCL